MNEAERQEADRLLADAVGMVQAMNAMSDLVDQFKKSLEDKGWSAALSEQAAVAIVGPVVSALLMNAAAEGIAAEAKKK